MAVSSFQFLGIPPKGEPIITDVMYSAGGKFPISRDPPEGGTLHPEEFVCFIRTSGFQFLGIPPKGERGVAECPHYPPNQVSNF